MIRQFGKYFAGLVALYLIVEHASGAGQLLASGAQGASGFTKTLQGR